jgi:NAD(P)-dependent dehydrogenase (short-subunit alcohol dehydrogenase family)
VLGAVAAGAYVCRGSSLKSRVAVVTGGSRGLGLALAHELVLAGCRVVVCARDADELARAEIGLLAAGRDVLAVICDVSVEDEARALVDQAVEHFGRIDIVVNNAGIIQVGPLDALTTANFRSAMDPMLWGTVQVTLAALPHMRARHSGHICNITSIGGKIAVPHLMPYSTAKFAAVGFSEGLRAEVAADGIHVTTVVPGLMRTGSDVQAEFAGDAAAEYSWFAAGAAAPFLSMDGRRGARRIVRAIRTRRTALVLTPAAKAAVVAHGVAPALTQRVLEMAGRLLPANANPADTNGSTEPGTTAAAGAPRAVRAGTVFNRRAGRRLNQPEPEHG